MQGVLKLIRLINLQHRRFGRLLVSARAPREGAAGNARWLCVCDCGNTTISTGSNLTSGDISSCGCLKSDSTRQRMTRHGGATSPEYKIWKGMIGRCHNKNRKSYAEYGGAGIIVCEQWRSSFSAFISYMGSRPSPGHSIDRYPNMQGNYEPGNCRWATIAEQAENQQDGISLILDGELMSLPAAAKRLGISYFAARWKFWTRDMSAPQCGVPS